MTSVYASSYNITGTTGQQACKIHPCLVQDLKIIEIRWRQGTRSDLNLGHVTVVHSLEEVLNLCAQSRVRLYNAHSRGVWPITSVGWGTNVEQTTSTHNCNIGDRDLSVLIEKGHPHVSSNATLHCEYRHPSGGHLQGGRLGSRHSAPHFQGLVHVHTCHTTNRVQLGRVFEDDEGYIDTDTER